MSSKTGLWLEKFYLKALVARQKRFVFSVDYTELMESLGAKVIRQTVLVNTDSKNRSFTREDSITKSNRSYACMTQRSSQKEGALPMPFA